MAVEEGLECTTYTAGADLSAAASQYKLVKMSADRTVVLCAATTDQPIGVLQNKPKQNAAATVAIDGDTKCRAGGLITAGDNVAPTAAGLAQTSATGQQVIGIAKTGVTNSGELFTLTIDKGHTGA